MTPPSTTDSPRILLVTTPPVLERLKAVNGRVLPPWADANIITDEELKAAVTLHIVWGEDESDLQRTLVTRARGLGRTNDHLRMQRIDVLEHEVEARTKAVADKQRNEDERAERQERARRKARHLVDAEEVETSLDRAASSFDWEDLAALWDDEPVAPSLLARSDGGCGFYTGQRNLLVGYSESGKSWLALLAVRQEVEAGRPCVFFDYENGPAIIVDRLRALGLTQEQVRRYLRYAFLAAPLPPELAAEHASKLWAEGGRLAVHDALTPIAHALGLETFGGDTGAVEQVFGTVLDPWANAGLAAVLLDNVPKSSRSDVLGSQHKSAGIGGSILAVVTDTPFSRLHAGRSRVLVVKDRGGTTDYLMDGDKRLWAELHIGPDPVRRDTVNVFLSPPPAPAAAVVPSVATVVDIVRDTCELAAEALRRNGLTEVRSMRRLADLMDVVRGIDPAAYPAAHVYREDISGCLTKVADASAKAAAGIGVEVIATPRTTRYRVWLT